MKKKLLSVFMATMIMVIPATQALAQDSKVSLQEKIRSMASVLVEGYGASAVQYAINDKGSIVLSDSFGVYDKATNAPITKDTMFGIGSTSKMYVSAATMILADANKVDIDKPLTMYIKDFTMNDERYKEITPRMLMNHTSGLYGTHYGNSMLFDDNDTVNRDELLTRLQSEHLKSDPGEYAVYCNDGFQLLEIMVERVSGISYSEFLDQYISTPLKLSNTKTPLDDFDREQLAKAYFPTMEQALPVENTNVLGAGGLYSTAEDITRFAEVLIGKRTDILSENSAKAMQNHEYRNGVWVSEETNSFNYGLGWDAVSLAPFNEYGITALSKGGDTGVYHSTVTTLPEYHLSVAVVSSGGSSIFDSLLASNILLEYLKDKGMIKNILPDKVFEPAVKVKMPDELHAYAGLYGSNGVTTTVEIKDGAIELPSIMGIIPPQQYVYTGEGQFLSSDGSVAISFDKQTNGHTYIKSHAYLSFPGVGQFVMVTYDFQKLANNPLNESTQKAWEHRNGKVYFNLDERINSLNYLGLQVLAKQIVVDLEHGYANGNTIVNDNKAVNAIEIPIMTGRDVVDLNFYSKGNTEYLTIEGASYISDDAVEPIYGGQSSVLTIQSEGQSVWLKIDEKSANKTMTVDAPAGGGFAVYDPSGMPINFSVASKENTALLPEGGYIVFGGQAGDVFKISLVK
jgi:CubicO group peptidase (beta-lactamase class C family)